MQQIQEATGGVINQPPKPQPATETPAALPDIPPMPDPAFTPPQAPPLVPPKSPPIFHPPEGDDIPDINDVVQIVNRESKLYGIAFIIGDIQNERIHGFYIMPGGKKEYVTVTINDISNEHGIAVVGKTKVKSHTPCSQKWNQEHGKAN